ncbi:MAG: rhodanese-like domain-containing protein [Planctomycetales bacterium]|nr:rhodanese-like domain-containing protein [bacterium]UNM08964.1 MAG: rhodanese-like domain-containing protein [Planctomycetales bacterium]
MAAGIFGQGAVPEIDATGAKQYIAEHGTDSDFVLLDVRTAGEIEEAHIAGCLKLDITGGEFQRRMLHLDPQKDYLLVCRSGNRSGYAAALMLNAGFRRAVNLRGGMLAWVRAGYPIETGGVDSA